MQERQALIEDIIAIELEMFLTVPTAQKASCQDHPESFRLHREAQFSAWSDEALESYLNDLHQAKEAGRNLMTIKYARMDDIISQESANPLIEKIVSLQYRWQQEMIRRYPYLMAGGRPLSSMDDSLYRISFETYLRGELETYSDHTLSLLYRDMTDKAASEINMSEEIYSYLVKAMGSASLEAADQAQKR
jgi:hypothetical protein